MRPKCTSESCGDRWLSRTDLKYLQVVPSCYLLTCPAIRLAASHSGFCGVQWSDKISIERL